MKQPHLTIELIRQAHFHSFDVFDTALTRIWAKPTDLFWELGNHLKHDGLITISPEVWSQLRIEAEGRARQGSTTNEVTLQEIYDRLAESLNWSEIDSKKAMHNEIQLERASLRPVPAIQLKIQA